LIASADRLYASALAAALSVERDLDFIGEATDTSELTSLLDLGPDLVVIMLPLGEESDWDVIAKCSARTGVLVVGPEDEGTLIPALEAGALGYVGTQASFQELGQVMRSIAAGVPVIPPLMLGSLLRHVVKRRRDERIAQERLKLLTSRERQVFEMVARGLDKHGISTSLFISPETARTHIHNILTKLGLHSQADLLALAAQCGFVIGRADG
jgi:DNA-binding NarL/FixJ family response regulator